jgi:hypothetical protein
LDVSFPLDSRNEILDGFFPQFVQTPSEDLFDHPVGPKDSTPLIGNQHPDR